jgi:NADPH:quinone reductase-like Zn-dependent oxidoreductase/SAM-dependent methyltransferase
MENGVEKRIADASIFESYASAEQQCTRHVDRQTFYNYTAANGISYGDYFQLLSDIRWDGSDTATASVDVTARYQTSDLVHPAILDSAVQVLITQSSHGATETAPTNVPYELRNGWLSASGWEKARSVRFLTKMTSTPSSQGMAGAIYAVNDSGTVLCNFERLVCKAIATASDEDDSVSNMLHRVEWRPHMNLLSSEQLRAICSKKSPEGDLAQVLKHRKLLESTLSKVLCAVFSEIGDEEAQRVPAFLEKYIVWMKDHVEKLNHAQVNGVGENSLETLFEELDHTYPSWSIFTGVARNLKGILTGQVNPLHVAFDTDLAKIFYSDIYDTICDERYSNLLELIIHGSHNLRIIEVGAGSGGWTKKTLAAIQQYESRTGANAISEYFYTDISPAFFEKAREQLPDLQGRLQFKPLNLEKDVEEQGFDLGHYDVVIAGSVLHATADLTNTVRNVRKLLKPSGHLINLEVVVPHKVYTNFAFGTLPGWWLSTEEWRSSCPCIDESQWDRLLKENQFSGNDLILRDFEDSDCHTFSILVSTAIEARTEDAKIPSISLLADPSSQTQSDVAEIFKAAVSETTVEIIHLDKEQVLTVRSDTVVISLLELDKPFFSQASEHEFQLLKRLTNDYNNILWLTANCVLDSGQPYSGYAQGFFRSVRSERMEKHIVTLSVESTEPGLDLDAAASLVKDVFEASFVNGSTEVEYIVRNGCILTGRLVEDKPLAEDVASMIVPLMRTESWLPGPPLKVSIGTPGLLDTIHFTQDILPQDELDDEEVEIEAKTWGLSFRDIFVALGRLEGTDLGIDCAGVITRVGSACQDLSPGDRVVMTTPGCMRSFPRGHRTCVVKIPDTLSFEVAASILNPGTTAYYCLMEVARLQKGESILIHSATGSTGQLAILLAQMIGAEVYATVGFAEKKQLLIDEFNVPEDHIFYSRNTQFAAGIKRMTGGRGVDVILNSLSGDSLLASWGCIAPYGRFIEIGKSDIVADSPLPMGNFARNVSFCAVDLYHVMESSPNLVARLAQKTVDLLTQGLISHPKPLHVYPVSELEQAFRLLQSGKNTGRIVIKMSPDDQVKVSTRSFSFALYRRPTDSLAEILASKKYMDIPS